MTRLRNLSNRPCRFLIASPSSRASLRAAEEKIHQGDALLASRVGIVENADRACQEYRPGEPSTAHPGSNVGGQTNGFGVVWTKPIYDAASTTARERLNREAAQARVVYLQIEQDLMLRVASSYFEPLLAHEALTRATAQKQAVGEQLGLAKESHELGLTSVTDADDAQVRHDNLLAAEIVNRNYLANEADAFAMLSAVDPERFAAIAASAGRDRARTCRTRRPARPDASRQPDPAPARARRRDRRQVDRPIQVAGRAQP